ncbi:hypothetical protein [Quadrisphaera setariae]|uniref:DNA modification methylase n=1 Tax=Quadrisphaera setariae TaxID=2593304 RepID=A0A5C8ZDR8_9ACTN|nr:hypothetical protein [Quadrisphaera setariae]TXR56195.1 hypothetical protein FMM08_12330 [Quadrisphaera setariae]
MHLPRRALAASALALASLTAATGCTYTNAQQTAASYAPGAAAAVSLGTVHVAGLFVATSGEGAPASLVARIVNSGNDPVSVRIAGTGESSSLSGTFQVQPATTYDVGPAGEQTVTASSFSTPPGQVVTMEVTADGDTQQLAVPVLDGTLEQYAQYVPTATPTTTPTGSPSGEPSASGSPTPRVTGSPSATGPRTGSPSTSPTSARSATAAPDGEASETTSASPSEG